MDKLHCPVLLIPAISEGGLYLVALKFGIKVVMLGLAVLGKSPAKLGPGTRANGLGLKVVQDTPKIISVN